MAIYNNNNNTMMQVPLMRLWNKFLKTTCNVSRTLTRTEGMDLLDMDTHGH